MIVEVQFISSWIALRNFEFQTISDSLTTEEDVTMKWLYS